MANLDDLDITSISNMSNDERLELLRQIRLSRRVPVKTTKSVRKADKKKVIVNADEAAELLRILTGE